eukprot:CAMPEP_0117653566 /NCGR_PEP_ID=MMETSP0804-20121206/3261_1 /TAXON_ID=1074897 /ORGANISM="Tetraselmis astigmatica, Strain CCMP880" /LENGTH=46 /DNA_ID= /DNA_START= /DNA_END= /DNA_ORIENTATION=
MYALHHVPVPSQGRIGLKGYFTGWQEEGWLAGRVPMPGKAWTACPS